MVRSPPELARLALACLDLTLLNDGDDEAAVTSLCARARSRHGEVAAVCVWPRFAAQARAMLPRSIHVAAVANFPDGALDTERALRESAAIVETGGDEVDLVLPWRAWLAGEHRACAKLVAAVRRALATATLKLIIESGELADEAAIRTACELGLDEGVDFLKTSTGKTGRSATPRAARTMLQSIAHHARRDVAGFKVSGGVRSVVDVGSYVTLIDEILGATALTPTRFRIGASSLLADIEAVLGGRDAPGPPGATY
jgi:deoxyribose-phosphate aldolase